MHWRPLGFAEIDSTNEEIRRQAESGAAEGLVVTARRQTAGRGRRGRAWDSPEGNLFVSVLLKPRRPAHEAATLSFLVSLCVAEAVLEAAPALQGRISCKWPNDVLIDGAKLSGILLESRTAQGAGQGGGLLDHLIVGIGVNLVWNPADTPYPATNLAVLGVAETPESFLPRLLGRLGFWYDRWQDEGFAPVRQAWLGLAQGVGKPAVARLGTEEVRGRFIALDEGGGLILELADGSRRTITAGDVFPAA
ncbi:biotin--[acetyl-CoA-carboxylase] ligase [Ferrovibrio sp. MS7]|uniref:biotin--[acetyl-CoA-carboxylase] ligase n=1 Tax=Ferrovibrio plantarum TaxID=3119164 RepID=UPI003135D1AE